MNLTFEKVEAPQWMVDLFKAIDELDFSPSSGFKILSDDIEMNFINEQVRGIENAKAFFTKLDAPLITHHYITAVYKSGNSYIMKGSATLQKKGNAENQILKGDPLYNIFWLNDEGKVIRYIVDVPPQAGSQAGL
jgi:hypothetical protein